MGWLFATLLSKTDFSFAILLATFEPLETYQSYIPFWKAQECDINAWEAQGRDCMFLLRHVSLKMAILLHTVANWRFIMIIAVYICSVLQCWAMLRIWQIYFFLLHFLTPNFTCNLQIDRKKSNKLVHSCSSMKWLWKRKILMNPFH